MPAKLLLIVIVLLCATACSHSHRLNGSSKQAPPERLNISQGKNANDRIIFLNLQMALKDSLQDTYRFSVINTLFATGELAKNPPLNDLGMDPTSLYCEITDDNNRRMDIFKVINPLLKAYEYSSDKIRLEKKLFTSKTGDLRLRFQLIKNAKRITLYKPSPDLKTLKKIYDAQL